MNILVAALLCVGLTAQSSRISTSDPAVSQPGAAEAFLPVPNAGAGLRGGDSGSLSLPPPLSEAVSTLYPVAPPIPGPFHIEKLGGIGYGVQPTGSRIGSAADYDTFPYGGEEEKIRCFAVTFFKPDGDFGFASTLGAVRNVMEKQLKFNGKDLNIQSGRIFRTRMSEDRCIILCCINDTRFRSAGDPELFCIVVRLVNDQFIPYGVMSSNSHGSIRFLTCEDDCADACEGETSAEGEAVGEVVTQAEPVAEAEADLSVVRAEIKTGGYSVDVFVEKMSDGQVGFRFLKPR